MTTIENFERLIKLIDEKVAAAPAFPRGPGFGSDEARKAYWAAGDRILEELAIEEGATFDGSRAWEGGRLKLAGIKTSCTAGSFGLLSNWQHAARRKIAKLRQEAGEPA